MISEKMMMEYIVEFMEQLNIPYEYFQWNGEITYPYWTGRYVESQTLTEDGKEEYTVTLEGFYRGGMLILEQQKESIRKATKNGITGYEDGVGISIDYLNTIANIDTGDFELKKIQVNLRVRLWRE